jgi:FG-GAP-like repeat
MQNSTDRGPRSSAGPALYLGGAAVGAAAASLVAIGVILGLWKVGVMAAKDERLPPLASYVDELDRKIRQLAANEQGRAEVKELQARLLKVETSLNSPRAAAGEQAREEVKELQARLLKVETSLSSPRAAAGEQALSQVKQLEERLDKAGEQALSQGKQLEARLDKAEAFLRAIGVVVDLGVAADGDHSAAQAKGFAALANVGGAISIQVSSEWRVAAIADFNGDGKSDILWRHLNGTTNVFLLDGTTVLGGSGTTRQLGTEWQVRGVGDFNGDGRADILWRHADGSTVIWLMDGVTVLDEIAVPGGKQAQ